MINDVFLYAGEEWALFARKETLRSADIQHIGVIANRTHQGDPIDPQTLVRWQDELLHHGATFVMVDLSDFDGRTRGGAGRPDYQVRERAHRDRAAPDIVDDVDLILLSDVDEIPRPDLLYAVEPGDIPTGSVMCFAQRMHPWSPRWLYPGPWLGSTLTTPTSVFAGDGLQWMRDVRGTERCRVVGDSGALPHGGWHLSWWGTDEDRRRKLGSFSHYELVDKADMLARFADVGVDINGLSLVPCDPADLDWPDTIDPADWIVR